MINGTERILVCCGNRCAANGADEVASAIEDELAKRGLGGESTVEVVRVGCVGECDQGPIVRFMPRDLVYYRVSAKHAAAIVDSLEGEPVKKLLFKKKRQHFERLSDNPFFALQHRVALRHIGIIDPLSIEDYTVHDGYASLKKALAMTPFETLSELEESGLRIKCEQPFTAKPTWLEVGRQAPRRIVCNINADDPDGELSFALAEGSPHDIIEGMAIAMHATEATVGIINMKREDAPAYNIVQHAIEDARAFGIFDALGKEIVISTHDDSTVHPPLENESELRTSAHPDTGDLPTNISLAIDTETLAAIPPSINKGSQRFKSVDVSESTGTATFVLSGKAKHIGAAEIPLGTSLRTLIFKIGGGLAGDRPLKAMQIGGSIGPYLPNSMVDLPVSFDSFSQYDIPMSSGSLNILDDRTCIVKTTYENLRQLCTQGSGVDSPNSETLLKAIVLLERLCSGDGEPDDIELLNHIGLSMRENAANRREKRAAAFLLSSIEHFRSEFETHALEKHCPAGACPSLTRFAISADACAGCDACTDACPAEAIVGEQRQPHTIDTEKCISCGTCRDVCRFHAVLTERRIDPRI